nr:MAG TPA: hypothetical protein [Caudoviricetes sp.]
MWGFFYVARMDEIFTHPTPGSPCIPRRSTPASPSAPGTATHHRQQRRPHQMQAQTMQDTLHRSALDTRPPTPDRSCRWRNAGGRGACPKLSRFGQHNFSILCQKNKSEKSYIFVQKVLTYKIYLI